MHYPAAFLLVGSIAMASPLAAPQMAQGPDFGSLADRFLVDHNIPKASPDTVSLPELLEQNYLHTAVGLFDLYFPVSSASDLDHYQRLVVALSMAQAQWLEWTEPVSVDGREAARDAKTLAKWARKWDLGRMAKKVEAGELDILSATRASSTITKASERFAASMERCDSLGLQRENGLREPIVLLPDRGEFCRFLAFGGWLYPAHQGTFWQASAVDWTHTYIDNVKILSTRFAAPGRSSGDYSSGMSMDYRSETGMEQQIVQLAANSMFANYYGESVPPSLAGSLAVNLVIDMFGECNTRVDGDLRARRTSARELFVPGGNPAGGILPPNLADSRWRDRHGTDHFVGVLKRSLQQPKRRRDSDPSGGVFLLLNDSERERLEVRGPFLGSAASGVPVEQQFFGDQLEFLRSYRSCFMNWLRLKGMRSASRSSDAFACLLRDMALNNDPEGLEQIFDELYGMPLSGVDSKLDNLEAEFIEWLPKAR